MDWGAAKDVNHVNLRSASILVTAKRPALLAIIIVDVEDGKVVGVEAVAGRNVLAGLGNPARTPVVPGRVRRVQVVTQPGLKTAIVKAGIHLRLVRVSSKNQGRAGDAADSRSLDKHVDECDGQR